MSTYVYFQTPFEISMNMSNETNLHVLVVTTTNKKKQEKCGKGYITRVLDESRSLNTNRNAKIRSLNIFF